MKKIFIAFLIPALGFLFSACEKDDICVEGDTPLLIIRFYYIENRTVVKPVPAARVVGVGKTTTVGTFVDRTALDSIAIPLNPELVNTPFLFISDSKDENNMEAGNIDRIDFSYEIKEVFLGRACGFIATYDNLNFTLTEDPDNWIKDVTIDKTLVENPITTAHVKIFH